MNNFIIVIQYLLFEQNISDEKDFKGVHAESIS